MLMYKRINPIYILATNQLEMNEKLVVSKSIKNKYE